ncbi:MAG: glycogen/starch/alpha-glucan phosphorylase, partial [Acidobacteriota bacterium]
MQAATSDEREPIGGSGEPAALARDIRRHLLSTLGTDDRSPNAFRVYKALAYAVRDRLIESWIATQRSYYESGAKRVYYLSLEFLPGRFLLANLTSLGLVEAARQAVGERGLALEEVAEQEWEAGLGNGGLGRLASCYLDSLATLGIPAHGYGIRYDYGIFYQLIRDGWQVERPDNWLRAGNPWEFERPEHLYEVSFGGQVVTRTDEQGRLCFDWVGSSNVMAMACDILIPGFRNGNAINMRLWAARSSREFELGFFNSGNYVGAIEDKIRSENISRVLYPSETVRQGRELRLQQEYFFVSATFQDIMRRFRKSGAPITALPELVAVQLNDTHPAIAIAELMRLLVDGERMPWETAWELCVRTFGYTNHTVMPEALEHWPVEMLQRMLPRHLQIIFEINRRFLDEVAIRHP